MDLKRLMASLFYNIIIVAIPLLGHPSLLYNYKILIIILGSTAIWLTQPVIKSNETQQHRQTDKFSVLLIISMSIISVWVPVINFGYFNHADKNSFSLWTASGIFLMAFGIVLRARAVKFLGKFFTPTVQVQKDHELIMNGPYKILRHPSYMGAWMAIASGSLVLESIAGLAASVLGMGYAYYVRTSIEEKALQEHFGEKYTAYKKNTSKLIPYIW